MYLKSIEMQGFKSFADRTLMEFREGITGIVGPNGSGKSNIADAVRWVLGEQSAKQLRGGNMQDVIFSGTQSRKPLGFAAVTITLDNADKKLAIDYDTVAVTRRLFRSGESEYLMNGHACRLRDIQELFYDTGIGKEGYSIIGQGRIDEILSRKSEDRRQVFEEAAGIVKFRARKEEADGDDSHRAEEAPFHVCCRHQKDAEEERALQVTRDGFSTVTDLADEMVRSMGLSFSAAKRIVGRLVLIAREEGRICTDIDTTLVRRAAKEALDIDLEMPQELIRNALDPVENVNRRHLVGGPSPERVQQTVDSGREELASLRRRCEEEQRHLQQTEKRLMSIAALICAGQR